MPIRIEAVQISESFNIKKFRTDFQAEPFSSSTSEIFYAFPDTNRYLYIFDYGVAVFANYDELANDPNHPMAQQQKMLLEKYGGAVSARGSSTGKESFVGNIDFIARDAFFFNGVTAICRQLENGVASNTV